MLAVVTTDGTAAVMAMVGIDGHMTRISDTVVDVLYRDIAVLHMADCRRITNKPSPRCSRMRADLRRICAATLP